MKRASYREAIAWIAMNDDSGSPAACDQATVHGLITTGFVADMFGVEQERVARDIVRYRIKHGVGQ